jgi:hypothetical protein
MAAYVVWSVLPPVTLVEQKLSAVVDSGTLDWV